ncbi:hypothetical protein ACSMXM_16485 [Pacificimonas sp. ICDLI1SI03]
MMEIRNPSIVVEKHTLRLTAEIFTAGAREEAYFEFRGEGLAGPENAADPFVAAMLMPAMANGEALSAEQAISPRLHTQLPRLARIYHQWFPQLPLVDLKLDRGTTLVRPTGRAAAFFSGGVDSLYTVLKHINDAAALPARLTDIVYMIGVENRLDRMGDLAGTTEQARKFAEEVGLNLIIGTTNLRNIAESTEVTLEWEPHYIGSVLASIGLALSGNFDFICIGSTHSYSGLEMRYGTSPLTDELFSNDACTIIHDGCEVTRAEKVEKIFAWDEDLTKAFLRVCAVNDGEDYNCGRCGKCVRTAIELELLGKLDGFPDLARRDEALWYKGSLYDKRSIVEEHLAMAERKGLSPRLESMLRKVLRRRDRIDGFTSALSSSPLAFMARPVRRLL